MNLSQSPRVAATFDEANLVPPTAPRSAPPASPAPGSTAASSTDTATYSTRSTPSKPPRRPPGTHPARPSPAPPCRPTCSPPANAPNASTAAFGNWKSDCPKRSAKKPGRNQVSALHPISTTSTRPSVPLSSRSSTCAYNSTNATRTSPPHAPPTANSSPNSTPQHDTDDTPNLVPAQHLSHTLNSHHQL